MGETITVLFVGGPKDRVMMTVEKRPYIRVSEYTGGSFLSEGTVKVISYHLNKLSGGDKDYWVYVVENMSMSDVLGRLIGQYTNPFLSNGG